MDSHKNLNKKAYDLVAQNYKSEHAELEWEEELRRFVNFLLPDSKLIIDLGCGPADETLWLAKNLPKTKIVGVDISSEMVMLQSHLPKNVKLIEADMTSFYSEESVDGVWARASLHHLTPEEIEVTFSHIRSYLKPGGVVGMINKYGKQEEFEKKEKYGQLLERYFQYFDEDLVNGIAKETGLKVVEQYIIQNDHKWLVTYLKK